MRDTVPAGTTAAGRGPTPAPRRRHPGRALARMLPLLPAILLLAAFLLGPIVARLERGGLPRAVGVGVVLLTTLAVVAGVGYVVEELLTVAYRRGDLPLHCWPVFATLTAAEEQNNPSPAHWNIPKKDVISSLQVFVIFQLLTRGGPQNQTQTMLLSIYENAFRFANNLGLSAAMSMVLFMLILVLTVFQFRLLRTEWEY